jgi:integrase
MSLKFQRLTRPAVRILRAGERICEHGITAEKHLNGDVRYSIGIMVDGQRIHRVIGRESEGVTREQAERYIEKARTESREERLDLPQGRKLYRSFSEAAEDYLNRLESTDGKNLENKKHHLNKRLVPALGSERLDKITTFRLNQYRKTRRGEGATEATINREMATFSHLMRKASSKDWRWIKPDAVPQIPKVREARKKIRILSVDQRQRLLTAAANDIDPHIYLFVMFGLNSSMRHGEIVCRRFDEIDFDHCRIWIDRAKAGEREQPITLGLRDALLKCRDQAEDPDGWIFPVTRCDAKTPYRRDMRGPFARIVTAAGLNPRECTPHVMRHTAISALVMARTDIPTIQKISGHKTTSMVLHYVHLFGEHIDEAIRCLDLAIPDQVTPKLHTAHNDYDQGQNAKVEKKANRSAA